MIWRSGSIRWLPPSRTVLACAGIFLSVSAVCQSDPAALMPGCLAANQQGLPAELRQTRSLGSKRDQRKPGIGATGTVLQGIQGTSYPELAHLDLRVRSFRSQSDYFRTRFSLSRFLLLLPMRYFVDFNPALFQEQAPSDGVCAILAHELVHVVSLSRGNRIRRLGLVRLLSEGQITKFERRADLEAIHRGYGDGLKSYREWVYGHIPPSKLQEKRRNYFSPEEIAAIEKRLLEQPNLFSYWSEHVPMNLRAIENGTN
jgi:hypothetical protein